MIKNSFSILSLALLLAGCSSSHSDIEDNSAPIGSYFQKYNENYASQYGISKDEFSSLKDRAEQWSASSTTLHGVGYRTSGDPQSFIINDQDGGTLKIGDSKYALPISGRGLEGTHLLTSENDYDKFSYFTFSNDKFYQYAQIGAFKNAQDGVEVIYARGKPTTLADMPKIGSATYEGDLIFPRAESDYTNVYGQIKAKADFKHKSVDFDVMLKRSAASINYHLNTLIVGNVFSGKQPGSIELQGGFYGPRAENLSGSVTIYPPQSKSNAITSHGVFAANKETKVTAQQ